MRCFSILLLLLAQSCFLTNVSAEKHELNLEPHHYLIPSHHHVKHFLDKIVSESDAFKNAKLFARAGFKTIAFRSRGSLRVAKHHEVPGYLFKLYLGNIATKGSRKYKKLIKRAAVAAEVRKIIHHHHMRRITVPDKWLYEIPNHDGEISKKKKFILVVQDMELVSRKASIRAWKNDVTPEILHHLYYILSAGYTSLAIDQNIPRTKYGTFSCIDTEYNARKFKLKKIDKFLSKPMRQEWHKIIQEHREQRKG